MTDENVKKENTPVVEQNEVKPEETDTTTPVNEGTETDENLDTTEDSEKESE